MSASRLRFHHLAVARRAVRVLAALAEKRASAVEHPRSRDGFRPLTESEIEPLLGAELLASLMDVVTS
jgi:hypothetical protein